MASKLEKLENSTVKVQVEVPAEDFSKAIQTAYMKERGRYNIQGFRKGKAPRKMIENFYGDSIFYEGAVDELWRDALNSAVEEHKLELVGQPNLDLDGVLKEGEPVNLIFTIEVYPEVKLGKYKGVEVTQAKTEVKKEDVQAVLERERDQRVRYSEVDRPIQDGDRIVFDYKGKVGDEYFEGGTAEKATLDIGSNSFIPGFEDGMIGIESNVWREISVNFPEDYHAEDLSGKQAVFEVFVHEIREKELPEIDDDLAKDASEFDTLAEWKKDIKANLMKQAEEMAKQQMRNEAISKAAEKAKIDIPNAMIESQMDSLMQDFEQRLAYQGLNLDVYCQYAGTTKEAMREERREEAENRVRNQIVLDEITKVEEIKATPEETEERIKEYAEMYQQEPEDFKKGLDERNLRYIEEDVAITKTLDFILDNAKMVEPKPEKKAPAKKAASAAKKTTSKKADDKAEEKPKKAPAKKATAAKKTTATKKATATKADEKADEKPKKAAAKKTTAAAKKPAAKKTATKKAAPKKDAE